MATPAVPPMFSLAGRVALVTGASRGLGLGMAEGLAGAGATVVLNGRDRATLEAAGFEVLVHDANDIEALLPIWKTLGYDQGADDASLRSSLFVWYTLARAR